MASDWEKEYEEDLRRMQAGQTIEVAGRRVAGDAPSAPAPSTTTITTTATTYDAPPPKPDVDAEDRESRARREAAEEAEYLARYENNNATSSGGEADVVIGNDGENWDGVVRGVGNSSAFARAKDAAALVALVDPRIGIPYVPIPTEYAAMCRQRFGPRVFFATEVDMLVPGMMYGYSSKKRLCIICPNVIYLVHATEGRVSHAAVIYFLKEVWEVEDSKLALRDTEQPKSNLFIDFRSSSTRSSFLKTVKLLAAFNGKDLTSTMSSKPLLEISSKPMAWPMVEDPRTGLPVVSIPQEHRKAFEPLLPKIIHYFGFCDLVKEDWKGGWSASNKVAIWLTATCVFVSDTDGPARDGKKIQRCVAIEFVTDMYSGPNGWLGLRVRGGPAQCDFIVNLATGAIKDALVFAIQCIHKFRATSTMPSGAASTAYCPLAVHKVERSGKDGFSAQLSVKPPKKFKVEIFALRTKDELTKLLMSKV